MLTGRTLAPLALLCALAGCGQSMTDQPRYDTYAEGPAFENAQAARLPPEGTVPQSAVAYARSLENPPEVTSALLERGRERFGIFCAPCHGLTGEGNGMIVQRGFPPPPSFHSDRLRSAPASHFLHVIANGYGVMYSYASRVEPADRWAIIAYVRALQLSRHADVQTARSLGVELP